MTKAQGPNSLVRSLTCASIGAAGGRRLLESTACRSATAAQSRSTTVAFSVERGRVLGFLGRNGAGKTTTMRSIFGLVQLDGGTMRWEGEPIDREARFHFGYMPEERGLYPRMAVQKQLEYFALLRGLDAAKPDASRTLDGATGPHGAPTLRPSIAFPTATSRRCSSASRLSAIPTFWCWTSRSPASIPSLSRCCPP